MNAMIAFLLWGLAQGQPPQDGGAATRNLDQETPQAASTKARSIAWPGSRPEAYGPDLPPPPYTERRWIGKLKKSSSSCPQLTGDWEGVSMLDLTLRNSRGTNPDPLRKLGLDKYCVFTSKTAPNGEGLPPELKDQLIKPERDRMALSAMAPTAPLGPVGEKIWRPLADQFANHVGYVSLDLEKTPGVRLVFIDTHPTGEGSPAEPNPQKSWHGYTMAHLAKQMLCPNEECAIELATRLALRYDGYSPDMQIDPPESPSNEGGRLGLVGDLAVAILAEVAHWQDLRRDPGYRKKLILNLSVGWDSELLKELKAKKFSKQEPSAQLVYKALQYAAEQGVLVIASAGNRRGGPVKSKWPVLPAAWELRRPCLLPFPWGSKLVYAVGGLDWQGQPLSNSRHGAMPRRMAYGDHAVAATSAKIEQGVETLENPTMIYTGTSVSSAVTSSIAAAVWSLRPDLGSRGVMRRIFHSAEILDDKADYYAWKWMLPGMSPRLRNVSLCRSILLACGPEARMCDGLNFMECRLWSKSPPDLAKYLTSSSNNAPLKPAAKSPLEEYWDLGSIPGATIPQPGENPCPGCSLVPDQPNQQTQQNSSLLYNLEFEIVPDWKPANANQTPGIYGAKLTFDCPAPPGPLGPYDLWPAIGANPPLFGPFSKTIGLGPIIGNVPSLDGCTASVDFEVSYDGQNFFSVQSPVTIDPP